MKKLSIMMLLICCVHVSGAVAADSPYRGEENREIKALSREQVEGYLAGKGMGLAKAAELNHYPGPMHVLELADRLGLTPDQTERTRQLKERVFREAGQLGAELLERERLLDREFASGTIDAEKLRMVLNEIGALSGKIRFVHLHAHLEQRNILTAEQVAAYDALRGYAAPQGSAATR